MQTATEVRLRAEEFERRTAPVRARLNQHIGDVFAMWCARLQEASQVEGLAQARAPNEVEATSLRERQPCRDFGSTASAAFRPSGMRSRGGGHLGVSLRHFGDRGRSDATTSAPSQSGDTVASRCFCEVACSRLRMRCTRSTPAYGYGELTGNDGAVPMAKRKPVLPSVERATHT